MTTDVETRGILNSLTDNDDGDQLPFSIQSRTVL